MMKTGIRLICLLGLLALASKTSWALSDQDSLLFHQANQAYQEGHYDEAIRAYEDLIEANPKLGTVYFNLGNAYFRKGSVGNAIFSYERALDFQPRSEDIRRNLSHVKGLLPYQIQDKRNWYIRMGETVLNWFTVDEIFFLFHFSYFLFIVSWVYVLFFRRGLPWGWIRKTFLWMMLACGVILGLKSFQTHGIRDAIVITKEGEIRYGPSDTDQAAFRLGEGLKVYVVDKRDLWSRVWLTNGQGGWMKNDQIQEIRLSE